MQEYYNTERRKGKHLTYAERNQILAMVRMGTKQKEIAERIGVWPEQSAEKSNEGW